MGSTRRVHRHRPVVQLLGIKRVRDGPRRAGNLAAPGPVGLSNESVVTRLGRVPECGYDAFNPSACTSWSTVQASPPRAARHLLGSVSGDKHRFGAKRFTRTGPTLDLVAERRVFGLIPSENPPTVQHVLSSVSGRSKCGRPIDTALPIPKALPICRKCTQFDEITGAFSRRPWRGRQRRAPTG